MIRKLFLAALLCLMGSPWGYASVAVYVGKNLTRDGGVILAGFGDEPSSHWLRLVPHQRHRADETITVGGTPEALLPGELIKIPQARETFRYLAMEYSVYRGLPGPLINGGLNEYGVAVRDVALGSRAELVAMTPKVQHGLNYSDIARIVLERAHTAREAVDIAVGVIEKYGDFTYGGNSHVFADANEGWVLLEFAGGKGLWVAHRLGPDDVWLNWRGYNKVGYVQTLPPDLARSPDYRASKNFISFATEQGWYVADGRPFNVIEAYCSEPRESSGVEVQAVVSAVRAAAPKMDEQVLMHQLHIMGRDSSGYGQVANLRAEVNPSLRTLWVAPGPPITAAFVPWRLGADLVQPEYRRHRYLTAGEAELQNIDPAEQGLESTRYANRSVKRLLYLVNEHRDQFLPEVSAALDAFDARQLAAQHAIERTAQVLLSAHEEALTHRYLTEQANRSAAEGLQLIDELAAGLEARTKAMYGVRTPETLIP